VAPVLNKVGAFTANPIVRNIIGQPKNSFNIRQIMDERKILIVNLSRGLIGEDNAALLGALMVTKVQMAAMSRADIDQKDRIPFYLYVDEFQNFATDSFATILSEARKYALNLTVANQYIAQMMDTVKDAVFGNVGSIISFRTSADDARTMLKYFEPKFLEYDLVHMHNRNFVVSMTIDGEKAQAFSAFTLNLPQQTTDYSEQIIAHSRETYAISRGNVETYVQDRYITPKQIAQAMQQTPKPKPAQPASPPQAPVQPVVAVPEAPPNSPLTSLGSIISGLVAQPEQLRTKRKRTRRRKKSGSTTTPQQPAQPIQPPAPQANEIPTQQPTDETEIRLR
jgi:type IV secretory pathway TraG/TraD family ATPase VirD4